MYVDGGKPLQAAAFLFTERPFFPLLDKKKSSYWSEGLTLPQVRGATMGGWGVLHAERATPYGGNRDMSTPAMIFSTFSL